MPARPHRAGSASSGAMPSWLGRILGYPQPAHRQNQARAVKRASPIARCLSARQLSSSPLPYEVLLLRNSSVIAFQEYGAPGNLKHSVSVPARSLAAARNVKHGGTPADFEEALADQSVPGLRAVC
jgi:hypothetical protein